MISILGEELFKPNVILSILFLLAAGWLMERIISKMALMCRSVHVVHVPWGILVITLLCYLNGYLDYKGVVMTAIFYLVSYPSMWYLNFRFSRDLEQVLKRKHATKETVDFLVWPEEVRWVWQIKRQWRKATGKGRLNDEVVDWILDYHGRNGYSQRHGIPIPSKPSDN